MGLCRAAFEVRLNEYYARRVSINIKFDSYVKGCMMSQIEGRGLRLTLLWWRVSPTLVFCTRRCTSCRCFLIRCLRFLGRCSSFLLVWVEYDVGNKY